MPIVCKLLDEIVAVNPKIWKTRTTINIKAGKVCTTASPTAPTFVKECASGNYMFTDVAATNNRKN